APRTAPPLLSLPDALPILTGSRADHRLPLRPSAIEEVARRLATAVGAATREPADIASGHLNADALKWIGAVAKDLAAHRGTGLRSEEHTSELQSRSDLVCR